jgi:imidazolonepropionase-like amidohydrolase
MNRAWLMVLASLLAATVHAEAVAIVHATAWTLTSDQPTKDATIVLDAGRIIAVAAGAAPPAGARVVDAGGRPVTPGLMHAASQLGLIEVSSATETVDHSAKLAVPGAAFDIHAAINQNSLLIQLARTDGLTRAVSYPSASPVPPFGGMGVLLHLVDGGEMVERARVGVFASVSGRTAAASVGSRAAQWQLLRTALETAKTTLAAPATPTPRPPDVQALEPVLGGRIPLAISTNRESDLREAVKLARDFNIRVVIIGAAQGWRVADELAAAKIAVILDPMTNLPISFDELGVRLDNAALLRKAGVTIAMALQGVQSYNAGASLREGAGLAVAHGLSYVEGLRSIISAPAQIWGVADRCGTIAPGLDADLVVWDGDPLEPSSLAATVFINGREVSLVTHQSELRDRYLPLVEAARAAGTQ